MIKETNGIGYLRTRLLSYIDSNVHVLYYILMTGVSTAITLEFLMTIHGIKLRSV